MTDANLHHRQSGRTARSNARNRTYDLRFRKRKNLVYLFGGNFTSQDDLITKMLKFITDYDQTSRPFAWTYAADPLKIG